MNRILPRIASIPPQLEGSVHAALLDYTQLQNSAWMEDFRFAVRRGYTPNYDSDWGAFLYFYFAANFFKTLTSSGLLHFTDSTSYNILDLGCGAGASTAGVLQSLNSRFPHRSNSIRITAVDRNPKQISLYKEIIGPWCQSQSNVQIRSLTVDALQFVETCGEQYNLLILSYLLIENSPALNERWMSILQQLKMQNVQVLIIDKLSQHQNDNSNYCVDALQNPSVQPRLELNLLHSLNTNVCPKYCLHGDVIAGLPKLPRLLREYISSWQGHDIQSLRSIFHENALYEINSTRSLNGIEEIATYWKGNALNQKDVEIHIHEFSETSDKIYARWTSRFLRTDKGEFYCLHGMLWLTVVDRRIITLREFYVKNRFAYEKAILCETLAA